MAGEGFAKMGNAIVKSNRSLLNATKNRYQRLRSIYKGAPDEGPSKNISAESLMKIKAQHRKANNYVRKRKRRIYITIIATAVVGICLVLYLAFELLS